MAATSAADDSSRASTPRCWAFVRSRLMTTAAPRNPMSTSTGSSWSKRRRIRDLLVNLGGSERKAHGEPRPAARSVVNRDAAAHAGDELGYHRQPDPDATGLQDGVARPAVE